MSKVSVIIPVYNSENYLKDALDSVLNQTYKDFEIIIIDDGSTDNSVKIVEIYKKDFPNKIHYLYQKNQGPAAARNNGLKNSKGKYIAFLDADDSWLKNKLEKQLSLFNSDETSLVYCDNYFINNEGGIIENYIRKIQLIDGDILKNLFMDFFLITSGVIITKECIDKIGFFDEKLIVGEDYDFFLRISKNYKVGVVKEKLFKRRVHQLSLSRKDYILDAKNDISTLINFIKINKDFYLKNRRIVKERISNCHFNISYRLRIDNKFFISLKHAFLALVYKFSFRNLKNFILCFITNSLIRKLKRTLIIIKSNQ